MPAWRSSSHGTSSWSPCLSDAVPKGGRGFACCLPERPVESARALEAHQLCHLQHGGTGFRQQGHGRKKTAPAYVVAPCHPQVSLETAAQGSWRDADRPAQVGFPHAGEMTHGEGDSI